MVTATAASSVNLAGTPTPAGTVTPSYPATVCGSDSGKDKETFDAIRYGTCISCLDRHPRHDLLQLLCRDEPYTDAHAYCRDCLTRLFDSSITDPSHFPPRCCSKIFLLFNCIPYLPQALFSRFVDKREELETPNRTYCSNAKCSQWIRPSNIVGGVATCLGCAQKTCTTCKK
jgi:hypothetical protein